VQIGWQSIARRIVPAAPFLALARTNRRETMSDDNKKHGTMPADKSASDGKMAGLVSKMQTVKSVWDKAPEGAKKANALRHYQSAEKAQKAGNDAEAVRELDEATKALT
jgi:hypothetical protein